MELKTSTTHKILRQVLPKILNVLFPGGRGRNAPMKLGSRGLACQTLESVWSEEGIFFLIPDAYAYIALEMKSIGRFGGVPLQRSGRSVTRLPCRVPTWPPPFPVWSPYVSAPTP